MVILFNLNIFWSANGVHLEKIIVENLLIKRLTLQKI